MTTKTGYGESLNKDRGKGVVPGVQDEEFFSAFDEFLRRQHVPLLLRSFMFFKSAAKYRKLKAV
jgi:hypothetical protein